MRRPTLPSKLRQSRQQVQRHAGRFSVSEWLSITQLIALMAGGIWTAMLFIKFDARERELSQQKTSLETQRLRAAPVTVQQDILIWQRQPHAVNDTESLGAEYTYVIVNSSNQRIRIVQIELHALLLPEQALGANVAVEIPPPSINPTSPWARVVSKRYLVPGEMLISRPGQYAFPVGSKPMAGGGGTGDMEPGEVHLGGLTLMVRPRTHDFIGFSVDALVRFPDKSSRWVGVGQGARLEPGEYPGSLGRSVSPLDRKQ